jgi:hypothetical protein
MPIICIAPSPTIAIATRSGYANFAATAYGTPGHIVASVPDSAARMPARSRRWRAHQFVPEPESAVTIARSGRRELSSQKSRCGLSGFADSIACASRISHQRATCPSISSRHARSSLRRKRGSSACNVSRASPCRLTSIG